MAETTIDGIVTTINRRFGRFARCTSTYQSTAHTLVSTDLTDPDNAFRAHFVRVTSGAYSSYERLVTASAIGRLTCNPFPGAIVSYDDADAVASKIRTALAADTDVDAFFSVSGSDENVVLTAKAAAANDATMNIAYANGTCEGLTDDATSANTTAGVAGVTAQVETATIVGNVTKSGTVIVTVTAAGSANLASGKEIEVDVVYTGATFDVKALKHDDVTDAVITAARAAGDSWLVQKVDETNTMDDATQMYTLPTDLVTLLSMDIELEDDAGFHQWVPLTDYDVIGAPGARKLRMRGGWVTDDTRATPETYTVRYHYLALPAKTATTTAALGYGEDAEDQAISFIVEYALHLLHEQAFSRDRLADDARAHLTLSQQHKIKADEIKRRANMRVGTQRYAGPSLPRHI